jgi:hypothetical protein
MDPGVYLELTPAVAASIQAQQRIICFLHICFYFMFAACPPTVHRRQIAGP